MEPNVTWVVTSLEWDEDSGAILSARWKVFAESKDQVSEVSGTSRFSPNPSSNSFLSLDQVDEQVVLTWIKDSVPNYKNIEQRALRKLKAPLRVTKTIKGLPWSDPN